MIKIRKIKGVELIARLVAYPTMNCILKKYKK